VKYSYFYTTETNLPNPRHLRALKTLYLPQLKQGEIISIIEYPKARNLPNPRHLRALKTLYLPQLKKEENARNF